MTAVTEWRPNSPKAKAQRKGRGPHWVCYRCDHMVDHEYAECDSCHETQYIGRCNGRCVRCEEASHAV